MAFIRALAESVRMCMAIRRAAILGDRSNFTRGFLPSNSGHNLRDCGGGDGTRTLGPLDCQSSALPAELHPQWFTEDSVVSGYRSQVGALPQPSGSDGVHTRLFAYERSI